MSWFTKGLGVCLVITSAHTFAKQDSECSFHVVSTDEVLALVNKNGIPFPQDQTNHADELCRMMKNNHAAIYLQPYSSIIENQRFTGLFAQLVDANLIEKGIMLTPNIYSNALNVTELDNYEIKQISSVNNQGKQSQTTQVISGSNKKVVLDQVSQAILSLEKNEFAALNRVREKLHNFDRKATVVPEPKTKDCLMDAAIPNPILLKEVQEYGFTFSKPKYQEVCEAYRVNNVQTFLMDSTVKKGGRLYTNILMFNGLNEYISNGIPVFTTKTVSNMSMSRLNETSEEVAGSLLYENAMRGYENQKLDEQMKEVQMVRQRLAKAKLK
ncbi:MULTISPECIES: hypothetical protein [Acinetobacter]|uniref:Uncharacterized protein n=1 Tax=Acinetobacter indicus TaxID=756892 RepID=A0A6C0Y7J8_9GAMM|nr:MULTISPECIES: hypothetical protein [Acinetobacter]QIC72080.1 hypothetical protein FSC09_17125 [Acinetobacter indicus]QKQ71519.1 hypothetical protein E5Y90_14905 [Acinetobacter sp. 10FS3-1]